MGINCCVGICSYNCGDICVFVYSGIFRYEQFFYFFPRFCYVILTLFEQTGSFMFFKCSSQAEAEDWGAAIKKEASNAGSEKRESVCEQLRLAITTLCMVCLYLAGSNCFWCWF